MEKMSIWKRAYEDARDLERNENRITLVVIISVALLITVLFFLNYDLKPATEEDYSMLFPQLEAIESNPQQIMSQNGVLTVNNDEITYMVENDQARLVGTYNADFKLMSWAVQDKVENWPDVIFTSFLFFCITALAFYIVSTTMWFCIHLIVYGVERKNQKRKETQNLTGATGQDKCI